MDPDMWLIARAVIRVKDRFNRHYQRLTAHTAGRLVKLMVTVPLTPPTTGKSSGRGMVKICLL